MQRQRRSIDPSYFSCERAEACFRLQGEPWQDLPLPMPLPNRNLNRYLLLAILLLCVY